MRYFPNSALMVLGALALLTLLLGFWAGRGVRSAEDFLAAGRRANRWWTAASLWAALGSGLLLVSGVGGFRQSGIAGLRGLAAAWLWLPLMVWVWAPIVQRNRFVTGAEYLGRRFGVGVERVAAGMTLLLVLGLAGLEVAAFGVTLRALTGQPALLWMAMLVVVVAAYAAWGGQLAVLVTDGVLALLVLGGLAVLVGVGLNLLGPVELWLGTPVSLRSLVPEAAQGHGAAAAAVAVDLLPVVGVALLANQAFTGRIASARGERSAGAGLLWAVGPLGAVLLGAVAVAGMSALALGDLGRIPALEAPDVVLGSLVGALGGPVTLSILAGLLLAAVLSTLDGLLVAAAALVAVDLWGAPSRAPSLGRARLCTLLAGAVALGLAVLADLIGDLGPLAGLLGALVGAPVALLLGGAVLVRRLDARGAWATLGLGLGGGVVGWLLSGAVWSTPAAIQGAGLGALVGSVAGLVVGVGIGAGDEPGALAELTRATLSPAWAAVRVTLPLSLAKKSTAGDAEPGSLPRVRLPATAWERLELQEGHEVHVTPLRGGRLGLRSFRAVVGPGPRKGSGLAVPAAEAQRYGLAAETAVTVERVA